MSHGSLHSLSLRPLVRAVVTRRLPVLATLALVVALCWAMPSDVVVAQYASSIRTDRATYAAGEVWNVADARNLTPETAILVVQRLGMGATKVIPFSGK